MVEVFISYSKHDKKIADAICHYLEEEKVKCCYAPRDMTPGMSWSGEIVRSIKECIVLVLVLSSNSNLSPQVEREIEVASNEGKIILPFRVEDIELSDTMYYYIKKIHWLDALSEPRDVLYHELVTKVHSLIKLTVDYPATTPMEALEVANPSLGEELKNNIIMIQEKFTRNELAEGKNLTEATLLKLIKRVLKSQTGDEVEGDVNEVNELIRKLNLKQPEDKEAAVSMLTILSQFKKTEVETGVIVTLLNNLIQWYEKKHQQNETRTISTGSHSSVKEITKDYHVITNNKIYNKVETLNGPASLGTGNVIIHTTEKSSDV